jgi:hypothetical protein
MWWNWKATASAQPATQRSEDAGDNIGPTSRTWLRLASLSLGATGVVFGDVGTSPLYAFAGIYTEFPDHAVTPDEVGSAWRGGRLHLSLESRWNGQRVGLTEAGPEMVFHFGQLMAHVARTRRLRAGTVFGSGTVSNKDWSHGFSCVAEKRAIEMIQTGAAQTPFMRFGDTIRIEMLGEDGMSLFGAIEQRVMSSVPLPAAEPVEPANPLTHAPG